ncbi:MAG: DUF3786 domain-containing protein [Candidatus Aquicultor sp.]
MSNFNSALDVYKILNKSNCRQCQVPTCMAFASLVFKGEKTLDSCPHIDRDLLERFGGKTVKGNTPEQNQDEVLRQLKSEIAGVDFPAAAKRLGARLVGNKLAVTCLGKNFFIDNKGTIDSECHVNAWLTIPLLTYIVSSKGSDPQGNWVTFAQLKEGMAWNQFFQKRCEEPLKRIADADEKLFFDIAQVFGGTKQNENSSADWSLIIHLLPKVPFLIRYWNPEDDFESDLKLFFDRSTDSNLNVEVIYLLARGIVEMFKLIMLRHSATGQLKISIN